MKNPEVRFNRLERKRGVLFQTGMIIALSFVLLAFEWKTPVSYRNLGNHTTGYFIDEEIVPVTVQKEKLIPPKPAPVTQIKIIPNNIKVDDVVIVDVEVNQKTVIEPYVPVLVPEDPVPGEDILLRIAEKMPEFPGGLEALYRYLTDNIKYPEKAKQANITGTVYISFIVEKDGSVGNIKLLRGIGYGCDEEALHVISNMPDWVPGMQGSMPVRVTINIPVKFNLL